MLAGVATVPVPAGLSLPRLQLGSERIWFIVAHELLEGAITISTDEQAAALTKVSGAPKVTARKRQI